MHEYPYLLGTGEGGEGEEKPFGQAGQKWYAWPRWPLNILLTFFLTKECM